MTTTKWARLPNAQHIDWVLASLKRNPRAWGAAWDDARDDARGEAWRDALGAAWGAARGEAWGAALGAARDAARGAARGEAWGAAWDACAAFIAWDDAADVWAIPTDAVRLLAAVGDHRAILLLPACTVRDRA